MNLDLPRETLIRYVWGARELRRKAGLNGTRTHTLLTNAPHAPTQSLA